MLSLQMQEAIGLRIMMNELGNHDQAKKSCFQLLKSIPLKNFKMFWARKGYRACTNSGDEEDFG